MNVTNAYRILILGSLIWFSFLLLITLFRAIIGPRVTDRILSINMICTMVIACTCILAWYLNESYLFDVAILYAMLSFITVLILSATYIPKNPTRAKFAPEKSAAVETAVAESAAGTAGTIAAGGVVSESAAGTVDTIVAGSTAAEENAAGTAGPAGGSGQDEGSGQTQTGEPVSGKEGEGE